jgi:hypothetical protein
VLRFPELLLQHRPGSRADIPKLEAHPKVWIGIGHRGLRLKGIRGSCNFDFPLPDLAMGTSRKDRHSSRQSTPSISRPRHSKWPVLGIRNGFSLFHPQLTKLCVLPVLSVVSYAQMRSPVPNVGSASRREERETLSHAKLTDSSQTSFYFRSKPWQLN